MKLVWWRPQGGQVGKAQCKEQTPAFAKGAFTYTALTGIWRPLELTIVGLEPASWARAHVHRAELELLQSTWPIFLSLTRSELLAAVAGQVGWIGSVGTFDIIGPLLFQSACFSRASLYKHITGGKKFWNWRPLHNCFMNNIQLPKVSLFLLHFSNQVLEARQF